MILLGVASAIPTIVLAGGESRGISHSAATLTPATLAPATLAHRAGVRSQRISLPEDYISVTGNVDPLEGWKVATITPTKLGAQVARDLLGEIGISIERIGLVLGDTGTPYQTCPSEAQRIVGELGVKTAAFDLVGGIGAIPHLFSVISRWSEFRIPEYLLYVSTNTPSQQVNYTGDPDTAHFFGDAAVALLFGKQTPAERRSLRVVYSGFRPEDKRRSPIVIERSVRIDKGAVLSSEELDRFLVAELQLLKGFDSKITENAVFVAPQLYAAEAGDLLTRYGVAERAIVSGVADVGFSLGSAHGIALTRVWSELEPGRAVVLMHCGDGQCGSVVLVAS
jgi:hypothetical protein